MLDTSLAIQPNYEGLLRNLRREDTPDRVYNQELFLDHEVQEALHDRFGPADHLDVADPYYPQKANIALHRFLGYDTFIAHLRGLEFPKDNKTVLQVMSGTSLAEERRWQDESHGPIASWEDFEAYPWPDLAHFDTSLIEWATQNVPDDMCLVGWCMNVFEETSWLFGYERLCYALYDQPDLVDAVFERVGSTFLAGCEIYMQFDRVKILFDGDDMGHRSGTLISPQALIEKALPWHKKMVEIAHANDKLYLLHSCGNIEAIMPALVDDVGIDGRHSFEDTILPVTEAKRKWGNRIAIIGGIDVDFLCRAAPERIRQRVRDTLDVCMPGGGYCLGTGNSVTDYIPLDNYLAMLDEGRKYAA